MSIGKTERILLAKQCLTFKGFSCDNKDCFNKECPLNQTYK